MSRVPPEPGSASATTGAWPIALAGLVSLAVAMGIGRFAFTPLLPMMLHDGVVDLPGASWLASANYLGYMLGALLCTLQPWLWARCQSLPLLAYVSLVRVGLVATGLLTLAMAWQLPAAWPGLRFAAGVTSGVVFVYTSGWCLSRLARLGVPAMGGIIYAGPGVGIIASGLLASAMVAWDWTAASGWLVFGVLAFALTAAAWKTLRGDDEHLVRLASPVPTGAADTSGSSGASSSSGLSASSRASASSGSSDSSSSSASSSLSGSSRLSGMATAHHHGQAEMAVLTLAYGLAGFGYIITATFLPVIARAALPGSAWLDLFWPLFGLGVTVGALLATRLPPGKDFRLLLAGCYGLQALGIGASLWSPSLAGFAIGSLLLGLPFTAITFFAMQEVRRLRPATAASFIGLLSATYGVGQILGPPLVALLLRRSATAGEGFALSLQLAASALLVGAALYGWMVRVYPVLPAPVDADVAPVAAEK